MDTNIAFVSKKILKTKAIILPWKDHKRTTSSLFPEMNFWRALEISRVDYILLSNTLVKAKKWVPILSEPVYSVSPKIDTFWKSSRNFGHTTKFSTGPSWTPKSPKNQQFLWGPVTKKITQCAGPQKSHKNEFFETFFFKWNPTLSKFQFLDQKISRKFGRKLARQRLTHFWSCEHTQNVPIFGDPLYTYILLRDIKYVAY